MIYHAWMEYDSLNISHRQDEQFGFQRENCGSGSFCHGLQIHRHIDTQTHRHTDTQTQTHIYINIQIYRHTITQKRRNTYLQIHRQVNTQTHRHADASASRHIFTQTHKLIIDPHTDRHIDKYLQTQTHIQIDTQTDRSRWRQYAAAAFKQDGIETSTHINL